MTGKYAFGASGRKRSDICPIHQWRQYANVDGRLRNANILLIGMKALANEIAKNLVLAGIGSLTVVDDQLVTEDDLGAQFFVSEQHIGLNVRFGPSLCNYSF